LGHFDFESNYLEAGGTEWNEKAAEIEDDPQNQYATPAQLKVKINAAIHALDDFKSLKSELADCISAERPVIAAIAWDSSKLWHYVSLTGVSGESVTVMDPWQGRMQVTLPYLCERYRGFGRKSTGGPFPIEATDFNDLLLQRIGSLKIIYGTKPG
jgi:hypothetical protein